MQHCVRPKVESTTYYAQKGVVKWLNMSIGTSHAT